MAVNTFFKGEDNTIYIVGLTKEELGGSAYLRLKGVDGGEVPRINGKLSKRIIDTLVNVIDEQLVLSCHDLSEGGLGVAVAEMVVASKNFGAEIDLRKVLSETRRSDYVLFSESASRFLVEVDEGRCKQFEEFFLGLPVSKIGKVVGRAGLRIIDLNGRVHELSSREIKRAWRSY
jgi:phosphoribosylformylglycinamidine synthase